MITALTSYPGDSFIAIATAWSEALLNSVWQGVLLVLLVWLVLRVFRSINAATRQMIWLSSLVALAVLPLVSGRFAELTVPPAYSSAPPETMSVDKRPSQHVQPKPASQSLQHVDPAAPVVTPGTRTHVPSGATHLSERVPFGGNARLAGSPSVSAPIRVRSGLWGVVLMLTWIGIVAWNLFRLMRSMAAIRRIKERSVPMATPLVSRLNAWRHRLGIRRPAMLAWSKETSVPVVLGWRKPYIVFPQSLAGELTDEEAEQVALHELAHVARRDDWWQIMQRVIESVFFFNPAVYVAASQSALEREVACDDWVLQSRQNPKAYAQCLSRLIEHAQAPLLPVPGAVPALPAWVPPWP
jgi:beta-lactamase regulating signal transducer with metallopeptidase domain